jgi:L-asparaginase/Glu-tRNA(Gln) amidotransferase subunit D
MKTLSELSSLEVLVLRAAYVATGRMPYAEGVTESSQNKVLTKIVEGSGIAREYVDSAWQDLGTRKLLLKGTGLTHLGVKLCEYIEEYEPPVLG